MLNYTSKNHFGVIEATYNGQFAFIQLRSRATYFKLRYQKSDDWDTLWNDDKKDPDSADTLRILAHEYTHKHVFFLSETGQILNGIRLFTATRFLHRGAKKYIEDYYRMRTVHLMNTMAYHEALVSRVDTEIRSRNSNIKKTIRDLVSNEFQQRISSAETQIRKQWKSKGLLPSVIHRALYHQLGKSLQNNFLVQYSGPLDFRTLSHANSTISEKKFRNELKQPFSKTGWSGAVKKLIIGCSEKSLKITEDFETCFAWYWIGQRAQHRTLQEQFSMEYQSYWEQTLLPGIFFVMEWAGVPVELQGMLLEIYEDTLLLDKTAFMKRWESTLNQWKDNHHIQLYFGFFLQHGN